MTTATGARARSPAAAVWLIVPLLGLAVFINYVDRGNLPTAAPLIKDELGLSAGQLGLLISAFFWTYTPLQVLAGWLGEKINPYRTLALGLAVWSIATALTGLATGFAMLLALRLLLGLGETAAFPCSSKLIAQHVPPHRLGAANAVISQGIALGPAFGTLVGGLLMANAGWRLGFLIFGLASLTWLVPWLLASRGLHAHPSSQSAAPAPAFREILGHRALWGAGLGHFSCNYGFYFVVSWLPLYLVKAQGYTMAGMARMGGMVYLTYAVGSLVGGLVTDAWMGARASPNRARKAVLVTAHALAAAGLAVSAVAGPRLALAGMFLAAFALGAISPNIFAAGQTCAGPHAAGKWIGAQNCLGNVAGIVGPLATGFIVESAFGFPAAFGLAAAVTLLGVVGWGLVIPKIAPVEWKAA